MELTASNVHEVLMKCLYNKGEDTTGHKVVEGVMIKLGLNPVRLQENRDKIESMLDQLPDEFKKSGGGGYSFLYACMTKDGKQWGEHSNIDELICLGRGIEKVSFPLPKEMWGMLPGGMPYFAIAI